MDWRLPRLIFLTISFLDEITMNTVSWVCIELALADFSNLITRGHLAQLNIAGDPNTMFVDNIYFHQ